MLPRDIGLATIAQGGVALAIGINYDITYGGAAAGGVLTTIVLGMAIAQLIAPPLMLRALRAPAPAPPPSPSVPVAETLG